MDLTNRSILITGASSGIGKATAQLCCSRGANIVICARNEIALRETSDQLNKEFSGRVRYTVCDVSSAESVANALDHVLDSYGALHGVIHAAAVLGTIGPITENDKSQWEEAVSINLIGSFFVVAGACRVMQKNGGGRIVLFSGGGGGGPFPNYSAYACSKAAVVRLTETVAIEMAEHDIEINCVAPGMVATPMHEGTLRAGDAAGKDYLAKTQRLLEEGGVPASVGASAAAFLVSEASRGITGRFVAAPYDAYMEWPNHLEELKGSDLFTLRRIVPRDRGLDWQ